MSINENSNQPAYVKVGSYDLLATIGKGNFSVCKLAQNRLTNQQFAIKCIEKKNLDSAHLTRLYREIEIMKSLDHQHIVKLCQVMESKSMLYLVCEYANKGEIFEYIFKNGAMNEKMACQKFCQILSAVEYCHLKNIVHRDLKSENLLLDSNMNIKLVDFGFANYFDYNRTLKTFCGSPPYAAPEIFMGKKYYGPEIDIWSLGVILYVLVSASLPFDSENLQLIKQKVITSKYRVPYFMSQDCEDLISKILVVNSSKRYKMQQIKSHRWIKINNSSYYYLYNKSSIDDSLLVDDTKNKNRVKSKSLKLVGNRASKPSFKSNLAVSSISLPLYSFEENELNTINKPQIPLETSPPQSEAKLITDFNDNLDSIGKTPSFISHNIRRFSELVSNSSSVDEGVESDWSSSLSSDIMSLNSANSIQSFYLQSSNTVKSTKKTILNSSFLFNRKQKVRNLKLINNCKNKSKNSFDLRQIKHELNCLQSSISNIKNVNKCTKETVMKQFEINESKKVIDLNELTTASTKQPTQSEENSLQKFKQLIFLNNSKKKSISNLFSTKNKLFLKQKSSSLNSINEDPLVDETKCIDSTNSNYFRVHKFKFNSLRKYSLNKLV